MLTKKQKLLLTYMDEDIITKGTDKISKQVLEYVEQMEKQDLSKEELETMKKNYEFAYNESSSSRADIFKLGTITLSYIPIAITNFDTKYIYASFLQNFLLRILIPVIWIIYVFSRARKTIEDNARLRNRILAINMLLLKKAEEEKSPCTNDKKAEKKEK